MNALVQCMGGWCPERDGCAHFHAEPSPGLKPAERLCERSKPEPVSMIEQRKRLARDPRFAGWASRMAVKVAP